MSIASEITRIKTNVQNAYAAIESKGGTLPSELNSANLSSAIDSIEIGSSDGGDTVATQFNVTAEQIMGDINSAGKLVYTVPYDVSYDGVKLITDYILIHKFYNTSINSVAFPDLTAIWTYGCYAAFQANASLSSANFPKLNTITNFGLSEGFRYCKNLQIASFPSLSGVDSNGLYNTFANLTGLTNIEFPELQCIGNAGMRQSFYYCISLTSISFPKLSSVANTGLNNAFTGCTSLTSISFPALTTIGNTNAMQSMLLNCTNCTEIHFRSDAESIISTMSTYDSKFGATNASIFFDLPVE